MKSLLTDKVAIVTGGTSGIGLATVRTFVEQGAKVVVADIQDSAGAYLEKELGTNIAYVHTDVTVDEDVEAAVSAAVTRFGRLDIMFNNAGASGDTASLIELTADGFDRTIALLTRSVVLGHKYSAQQFVKQGTGGSIISTASAAGLQAGWSAAGYTIAKHAVVGAVRSAAVELGPYQIRSNAIAPGIIMTPIMAKAFGVPVDEADAFIEFLAERTATVQPIGRVGRPEDIANAALFLASDQSELVTGVVLPVDGGATIAAGGNFGEKAAKAAQDYLALTAASTSV